MNSNSYEKMNNFRIFSPRINNTNRKLNLSGKNNIGNYNEYKKISKIGKKSPINLYFSPKNISIPPNSKIPKIYSPLHQKLNKLYRSSSKINMLRPLSCSKRSFSSVHSMSSIKTPKPKEKIKKNLKNNSCDMEKEKLYQETYEIKKVVKILTKQLSLLKKENLRKDNQIKKKQQKINDIIFYNNNDSIYDNNINNIQSAFLYNSISNNNKNSNNNSMNNGSLYLSMNNINIKNNKSNNLSMNSKIMNKNINKNIFTLNLTSKIKKAIAHMNNEIKTEKEKYEKLKKSKVLTKMKELKAESVLLEEQINKMKLFINKSLVIQEENMKKRNDYIKIKDTINKQIEIIRNLTDKSESLDKEEKELKENLSKIKQRLVFSKEMIKLNKSKIKLLMKNNKNLSQNKDMLKESYTIMINNNPIEIKSFYTSQISQLNKLINFYTTQCKYSDNEILKLKDKRFKLMGTAKEEKKNQNDLLYFSIKNEKNLSDTEKINNLRKMLKNSNDEEKILKKKLNLYRNKLKELEKSQEQEELMNKSQIEFGIDIDNPYYTEDNNNHPENSNKFTSAQFNQFTYILFKNFEAKGISFDESKIKIVNPFKEIYDKYKINNVVYPSNEFDLITNEYTKIILDLINSNNKYNYTLTKIFISALFFNSECNINKLIEYFNVLFSYTHNYYLEEGKYITKLQNKYKAQTEKIMICIKDIILKESPSKYFQLLKMKDLFEQNEINIKDKYIEFLFYYMKKFDDPEAKLDDLKYSLLYDIIPLDDNQSNNTSKMNIIINNNSNNIEDNNSKIDKEEENLKLSQREESLITTQKGNQNITQRESQNNIQKMSQNESKIESKKENEKENLKENTKEINYNPNNSKDSKKEKKSKKEEMTFGEKFIKNDKKSFTEDNFVKKSKKNITEKNDKDNSDDLDDEDDSMTEIANEEYVKQLMEAIGQIQEGLNNANTTFNDLMVNVIQKRKILGKFYDCITIEDFNDQLKSIKIVLSDLKLSCLCSKYSIPNELRLIDKKKVEIDIEKYKDGTLKFDEDDNDSNI